MLLKFGLQHRRGSGGSETEMLPYTPTASDYIHLKEEFIDLPYANEFMEAQTTHKTLGVAYILNDAFVTLKKNIGYSKTHRLPASDWSNGKSFTNEYDYVFQRFDDKIYATIDGATFILAVFHLDMVGDLLGVAYSVMRSEHMNTATYAASLMFSGPEGVLAEKALAAGGMFVVTKKTLQTVAKLVDDVVLLRMADDYLARNLISADTHAAIKLLKGEELKNALYNQVHLKLLNNVLTSSRYNRIHTTFGAHADKFTMELFADAKLVDLLKDHEDDVFEISQRFLANNSTGLFKQGDAIEAVMNISKQDLTIRNTLKLTDEAIVKIQGHAGASFAEVVNDLDAMLTYSKTNNITLANFDGRITHWANATSDQSKGLHGLTKAIKDPKYADEFKGKTLTFEEGLSNARPGDHNSRIDITTSGTPRLRIEIKNYSGDTKITGDVIRSQFIERDLFNASSLDEIRWLQVGPSTTSKETIMKHIRANKDALEQMLTDGKLKAFFPDPNIDINTVDDFINQLEKAANYDKIFK